MIQYKASVRNPQFPEQTASGELAEAFHPAVWSLYLFPSRHLSVYGTQKGISLLKSLMRNLGGVLLGLILGGMLNSWLVDLGHKAFPLPEGVSVATMEDFKAAFQFFTPRHFIFPFLAHALGTLAGAFIAAKIAVSHQLRLGLVIGFFFLAGGAMMVKMVGGPLWFILLDLGLAYLPMAWLGVKLATCQRD